MKQLSILFAMIFVMSAQADTTPTTGASATGAPAAHTTTPTGAAPATNAGAPAAAAPQSNVNPRAAGTCDVTPASSSAAKSLSSALGSLGGY